MVKAANKNFTESEEDIHDGPAPNQIGQSAETTAGTASQSGLTGAESDKSAEVVKKDDTPLQSLPPDLNNRCRIILIRCLEFQSDQTLRAVFVTNQLFPFRSGLRSAGSLRERVDLAVEYLLEQRLSDGRPALSVFLEALQSRYHKGDKLRDDLESLGNDVRVVLTP